jgi:hypothetical protein
MHPNIIAFQYENEMLMLNRFIVLLYEKKIFFFD